MDLGARLDKNYGVRLDRYEESDIDFDCGIVVKQ